MLISKALEGDVAAIKLVFERTEGAVPQPLQLGGPTTIRIAWSRGGDEVDG